MFAVKAQTKYLLKQSSFMTSSTSPLFYLTKKTNPYLHDSLFLLSSLANTTKNTPFYYKYTKAQARIPIAIKFCAKLTVM